MPAEDLSWAGVEQLLDATQLVGSVHGRSPPLGKYWRSSPFVFSLVPRSHGDAGGAK
jgi:hypothetical protein